MKMKLYYVAYDFDPVLEMISGPYGTYYEASEHRDTLSPEDDERLKIVCHNIEVEE